MAVCVPLIELFSSKFQLSSSHEDFDFFEQKYTLETIDIPNEQKLNDCIGLFSNRDSISFYVNIDDADDDVTYFEPSDFPVFKANLEVSMRGIETGTPITIKISIRKQVITNRLSICSLLDFATYLESFTTYDLLSFFSEKIAKYETIVFISKQISQTFKSGSLAFTNLEQEAVTFTVNQETRLNRLTNIKSSTHATLLSDKMVIPEDFDFSPDLESELKTIIQRIQFTLIIFSIFDITHLSENKLTFRLNGYKGIDGAVDITSILIDSYINEYTDIYNWIYQSGNLNDKLGLARNIVSLHLNTANDLSFSGNMFSSILSAYKVYEKQNIKQYIEIRNKLSDQLIDYNKRANSIVESFASTFQKSALSVLTLFSSIIAIKVLGTSTTSGNFVTYSTIFSLIILGISLLYMLISKAEANEQKSRYKSSYLNFKERYTDLLNTDDIRRILNEDKEFEADVKFITKKIKSYTILWSIVLIAIFLFIIMYFINEKLAEISSVMINYPNLPF
ncbi:hypothetical protein [Pedobacter sp. GR22-10]|uniref:hypothetical protein n=1 Tax=Pedobacter sp. GR22-10 TaxID=2994472 RepID=UPI002247B93B|nr:hypothetical protein [Pedobacter sp. GR22-10]MCX2432164.1 hypothetical protein [Pedobacter sp. GR22-10]